MKIKTLCTGLLTFALLTGCGSSSKDEVKAPSKEELLTGNSSKSWNITSSLSDDSEPLESCKTSSPQNADNKWIFNKDNTFEYSNGTITDGGDCDGCCSDFANLKGKWSISDKDILSVLVNTRIDDGVETTFDESEILNGKITKMTETEFILSGETFTKL